MATPIPRNAARFTLAEIEAVTGATVEASSGAEGLEVRGVVTDSRAARQGCLFVALRGERLDGHAFLEAAAHAGSRAVVVERGRAAALPSGTATIEVDDTLRALGDLAAAHRGRWTGRVVGITGSAGKTTTKELTAAACDAIGLRTLKSAGNLNNLVGVPMVVFELDDRFDTAVIEMGTNHPGEIARLAEIAAPDVGVVTLAAAAHTEGLGTVEAVAEEKTSLWRALPDTGACVANADDAQSFGWLDRASAATKIAFGRSERADVRLVDRAVTPDARTRCTFVVRGVTEPVEVELRLLGEPAALDAAAALAAVLALGGASAIAPAALGLERVEPTPGRLHVRRSRSGVAVLDDSYNANPRSTELALDTLVELAVASGAARRIAILGDMKELGDRSAAEHERVGQYAMRAELFALIGCGREMTAAVTAAARDATRRRGIQATRIMHVLDPKDAIALARSVLRPGDMVLVKGSRSMQMERIADALCAEGEA